MPVRSLDWEDPLEEGMAIHSSILAWRTPQTKEPGRLHLWGKSQDTTEVTQHACKTSKSQRQSLEKCSHLVSIIRNSRKTTLLRGKQNREITRIPKNKKSIQKQLRVFHGARFYKQNFFFRREICLEDREKLQKVSIISVIEYTVKFYGAIRNSDETILISYHKH